MKGGKAGRKRTGARAQGAKQGRANDNAPHAKRPANAPPKKGSRKKSYGGMSSKGED
jgi:hypothetical protein